MTGSPIASRPASIVAGVSGVRQNAAVALSVDGVVEAFCEQERVTRVRRARLEPGALPVEALDAVLAAAGHLERSAVRRYVVTEPGVELPLALATRHVDHHQAHAATAFFLSPFDSAVVLVCDHHSARQLTVWLAGAEGLRPEDWPQSGQGLASLYAEAAGLFGLGPGSSHQLEALARLGDGDGLDLDALFSCHDGAVRVASDWRERLAGLLGRSGQETHRAGVAAAFQQRTGAVLLDLLATVRARTGHRHLALGGGLFYNTWLTTLVRESNLFDDVFVAPNPGNAGTAIGATLLSSAAEGYPPARSVSPFLGPEYSTEEVKRTLDNCKLSYECMSEGEVIDLVAGALVRGLLVGWFQGRMEWGHRALGNRSILASPLSPYVLDNLNVFLKHRERHRAYGVSVPEERASEHFAGPPTSRFMEYEFEPRDRTRLAGILPVGTRRLRVQTVPVRPGDVATDRYRQLHERFGQATGIPILVNTSFNGFNEPMVCSPRDAIRVFFGTGLDLLVMDRFVIRK